MIIELTSSRTEAADAANISKRRQAISEMIEMVVNAGIKVVSGTTKVWVMAEGGCNCYLPNIFILEENFLFLGFMDKKNSLHSISKSRCQSN